MRNGTINLIGWLVFVASVLALITSSLRSGDTAGLIGAVLFLASPPIGPGRHAGSSATHCFFSSSPAHSRNAAAIADNSR